MVNIGILGAGHIAGVLADTVVKMNQTGENNVRLLAVGARDGARAQAFAAQYGIPRAYGSYEAMLSDPEVQLVYVATPHSHHWEHMKLCIAHDKAILCEKAFTANAKQAEDVFGLARERGVLVAEAIWPRYQPMRQMILDVIASGVVGKPQALQANLVYAIAHKQRITDPALAGGALLDVGVYALTFAEMVFGHPSACYAHGILTDAGVDETESVTLTYEDGRMAILSAGTTAVSDREGVIWCEKGFIRVANVNNPERITVYDKKYQELQRIERPQQLTGYEYEVREAARCLEEGLLECPSMPWAETLHVMRLMDECRRQMGVVYPFE